MSKKTAKTKTVSSKTESPEKQLTDTIRSLSARHGLNHVFTTFLEVTALCLSIEVDPMSKSERLSRYEEIMTGMAPEDSMEYARMCALLYMATTMSADEPRDILGEIYMNLNLSNEWNGQFFTPDNICRMMGMIVGTPDPETIREQGGITINEPCCGSGAMVLGYAYAMKKAGLDYTDKVLFVAQDIDIRCVWMAYIQFWLYKIPAVVIHGNSLTEEEWSRWYTPYVSCVQTSGSVDMQPDAEAAVV